MKDNSGWPLMDEGTKRERGEKLVSTSDAWNFDSYLAKVIVVGLNLLKEGPAVQEDEDFDKMIEFFSSYDKNLFIRMTPEEFEEFDKRQKKAFKLLHKNFRGMWD